MEELLAAGVRERVVVHYPEGGCALGADGSWDEHGSVCLPADYIKGAAGAGDAFNSGFAVALAEGRSVVNAVKYGVVCGAIACTKLGVVPSLPDRARADAVYAEAQNSIWRKPT